MPQFKNKFYVKLTVIILNLTKIRCYFYIFSLDDASVIFNICDTDLTDIYCYKEKITQNICIFFYITSTEHISSKINIYNISNHNILNQHTYFIHLFVEFMFENYIIFMLFVYLPINCVILILRNVKF